MGAFPDSPRNVAGAGGIIDIFCATFAYCSEVRRKDHRQSRWWADSTLSVFVCKSRSVQAAVTMLLCGEGIISTNVWGREIRDAEERLKVFVDDFYVVRENIVLGPFPTHLGGTRLGEWRDENYGPSCISWIRQRMVEKTGRPLEEGCDSAPLGLSSGVSYSAYHLSISPSSFVVPLRCVPSMSHTC